MKKYETYKECGVEWMIEIPTHWEVVKLSYYIDVVGGSTPSTNVPEYWDGEVNWVTTDDLGKLKTKNIITTRRKITVLGLNNCSASLIPKNSVIISSRAPIGHLGILSIEAATNQGCKGLVPIKDNIFSEYLYYFLLTSKKELESLGTGSTFMEISASKLKDFKILLPSKEEQTQIAKYLDYKTDLIDIIIAQKEQLIEKLKEQRQALINEAVTKGLNPNAPLKDSGIEWLGEIPEHWEATSIKNILSIPITDGPHTTPNFLDEGVPFISAESIRNHKIDFNNKRGYISEEDYDLFSKKYIPEVNDIYMVKSGATTGNIAIVETEEKFTIWSPLAVFRANPKKLFFEYLFFVLQSHIFKYQVELNWSYGTQQNIGMGVLSNLKIVFPKDDLEQKKIVNHIKNSTIKTDTSIQSINESIKKLKEYRQSLISEAVTGKIDVRDWQPKNA